MKVPTAELWATCSQESFPDCTNVAVTKGFVTAHEKAVKRHYDSNYMVERRKKY